MMSSGSLIQERYKPEHPLPKELQEMQRDETVCQFCGVSYLVHNEIKKLEDEIEGLKLKLKTYEGFDVREAKLKRELEDSRKKLEETKAELKKEKQRNEDLESRLKQTTGHYETVKEEKRSLESNFKEVETELNNKIEQLKGYSSFVQNSWTEIKQIKENLNEIQMHQMSLQTFFQAELPNLQKIIIKLKDRIIKNEDGLRHGNDQMKKQLDNARSQVEVMQKDLLKATEQNALTDQIKQNLKIAHSELEASKKENTRLKSESIAMTSAITKTEGLLNERNKKIERLESEVKEKDVSFQEAKTQYEKKIEKYIQDIEAANKRCHRYENDINVLKKSRNNEEETIASNLIQLKVLKETLDNAKQEISLLKQERKDMVEAHQNRIRQLRESFQAKLSEADSWPKKLEEKLIEQQQRFNEDKNKLWEELNTSFQQEISNLKDKHEQRIKQLEKENRNKNTQLQDQLETLKRRSREEIENLKTCIAQEKEKRTRLLNENESLVHNLLAKISTLESKISDQHKTASLEDEVYKRKYIEARRAMELAQQELQEVERKLHQKEEEVTTLQETVRRECEERFELTEALSEARLQLLAFRRSLKLETPPKTVKKEILPCSPSAAAELDRRDFQRNIELTSNILDKNNFSNKSSQCFASKENGITATKTNTSMVESYNRKRIAEAISAQRLSSRIGFHK